MPSPVEDVKAREVLSGLAAAATATPVAAGAGDVAATAVPGRLHGFAIRETAGGAAVVRLRDGTDTSGAMLATINLAANGSDTVWLGDRGVAVGTGVFVDRVSGSTELTVFTT